MGENIKVSINLTTTFKEFNITMKSTHGKKVLYYASQLIHKSWEELNGPANRYIINDFKKTEDHKIMIVILIEATKKYGY